MSEFETIELEVDLDVPPDVSDVDAAQIVREAVEELNDLLAHNLQDEASVAWRERNFLVELGAVPILFKIGGAIGATYALKKIFSSVVNIVEEISKETIKTRAEAERQRIRSEIEMKLAAEKANIEVDKERRIAELRASQSGHSDDEILAELRNEVASADGRAAVASYIRMHFRLRGYS